MDPNVQDLFILKWVPENMYTFSIIGHIVNVYKVSGTHFKGFKNDFNID